MQKQIVEGFRLSPQQEHLWLLQQSEAGMPARVTCAVEIKGNLDSATLELAIEKTIARHEILRTTFQRLQGMAAPLQVVADSTPARIQQHDLSELQLLPQATGLTEILTEGYLPADFDNATPLYLSLLTMSHDAHILLISLPALCADAIGLKNFVFELGRCYAACLNGEEITDEPMQYPDFSEWQHEILTSEETEAGRAYWRQDGEANQFDLALPLETTSLETEKFSPQFISCTLNANTVEQMERVSAMHDSSLSSSLLAAFFLLLSRLTDSAQLSLGVCFDGRNYEELASALGLFSRFLPINADLSADPSFAHLLTSLNASLSDASSWQELFTQHTAASIAAAATPSFFPFCFEFIDEATPSIGVTDSLRFTLQSSVAYISRFKVLLRCLRSNDGSVLIQWHYDAAVYQEAEVLQLAERWAKAVESISAQTSSRTLDEVEI
ncbi:MAG TPA: condensation domain-containing protein, partial [Pyrinomonadaceae bacterium]|nr:condensation domain-containing protein [Pyrinomonadaceae bacterium]